MINTDRKYSVIVPVYNSESTLGRCVDSILSQTYCKFELILVNDGSNDGSAKIINDYAALDSRIVAIDKTNGGVSDARNVGLKHAKGDYIIFIDSDDTVSPQHLSDFQGYDSDLIISGIITESKNSISKSIPAEDVKTINNETFGQYVDANSEETYFRGPVGKAFRKIIIDRYRIQFDKNLNWGEDYLFVINFLSKCSQITVIPCATYCYYVPDIIGKYRMNLVQYEHCVNKTEEILYGIGKCDKAVRLSRLWSYQVFLGYFSCTCKRDRIKILTKFLLNRKWRLLPQYGLYRRIKYIIELSRVAILS